MYFIPLHRYRAGRWGLSMVIRKWATRRLYSGDLTALRDIAKGGAKLDESQIQRLRKRGFVAERKGAMPVITFPGRLALLVKRLTMHP